MTEGPRAHAVTTLMNTYMAGKPVEYIIAKSRRVRVPLEEILGKTLERTDAYGKNLLVFIDKYAVRIHTLIYGILRLYKVGDEYEKPVSQVRLVIRAGGYELVGFNVPILEIDHTENIVEEVRRTTGPDPLRPDWSREEFLQRLAQRPQDKIGVALLDQSIIAGIGNILRNEILFRAGINPERLVRDLRGDELTTLVRVIEETSVEFYQSLLRGEELRNRFMVYNRSRKPCPRCGTPIRFYRQEPTRRKTFICPNCQR